MLTSKKNKTNTMAKVQENDSNALNIIGQGTEITGEIDSKGDIRIDGILKGNLKVTGKLVLGPTGNIEGDISCKNADVSGKIDGKINVGELLSLKASAKIHGDIIASKIAIEPGAIFTGTCKMDSVGTQSSTSNYKFGKKEESKP